jgi:cytochrome c oxidase assembly protein subunit 15
VVIALLGLTAAFYILVRNDKELLRRVTVFTVIALAQGAIGYIQYFTGIPEILVAAHLLGATLVWIAAWRIRITVTKILIK